MIFYNYIYIIFICAKYYDNYTYLLYLYKFLKYVFKKKDIQKFNIEDDYIIINIESKDISTYTNEAGEILSKKF
tara:strand:- start:4458 stop:4679 length:222 start_codon:yes stop_codon:yes gene_type:complete